MRSARTSAHRSLRAVALLLPVALAAAACSSGSSGGGGGLLGGGQPAGAASTAPAASHPGASAPAPSAPLAHPGPGGVMTADQLKTVLLTTQDLPSGWTSNGAVPAPATEPKAAVAACNPLLDDTHAPADANVMFTQGQFPDSNILTVDVSQFASAADATAYMAKLQSALGSCTASAVKESDGSTSQNTFAPVGAPQLGDQSLEYTQNSVDPNAYQGSTNLGLEAVMVRSGSAVITVADVVNAADNMSPSIDATLVQKQLTRYTQALNGS